MARRRVIATASEYLIPFLQQCCKVNLEHSDNEEQTRYTLSPFFHRNLRDQNDSNTMDS